MLIKIFITAIAIYLIYFIFLKKPLSRSDYSNKKQTFNKKNSEFISEMVKCVKCNTYITQEDAIFSTGNFFCSKECVKQYV